MEHPDPGPLARDVRGASVLHVGCDAGALCLEALRRGAARTVGVDLDPDRIRLARSYASLTGLPAEFGVMDMDDPLPAGPFDVVVCSNLSEFPDPAAMLDRLGRMTGERMILEFEGPRSPRATAYLERVGAPRAGEAIDRWPAIVVGDARGEETSTFLSPAAVQCLLLRRSARFSNVEITPIGRTGRFRAIATRRVIGRLVVVAAAGRGEARWIVDRIRRRSVPESLLDALGMDEIKRWDYAPKGEIPSSTDRVTPGLVYGYDLHAAWKRRGGRYGLDELADLVDSAAEVVVVTSWAEAEVLQERGRVRVGRSSGRLRRLERHPIKEVVGTLGALTRSVWTAPVSRWTPSRLSRFLGRIRRDLDLGSRALQERARMRTRQQDEQAYRRPDEQALRYARWLDYCQSADTDGHWVVDTSHDDWDVHSASNWGHLLVERARRRHA